MRHPDADKQAAIDVFLGVHNDTKLGPPPERRTYQQWFHPENLEPIFVPESCASALCEFAERGAEFWDEYYRPKLFTSLQKHFAYSMYSSSKLAGDKKAASEAEGSPFIPRIVAPSMQPPKLMQGVRRWMGSSQGSSKRKQNIVTTPPQITSTESSRKVVDPSSVEAIVARSLSPTVPKEEEKEYQRYIMQHSDLMDTTGSLEQIDQEDYDLYCEGVQILQGDLSELEVPEKCLKLYKSYSAGPSEGSVRPRESIDRAEQYLRTQYT
ncbi:phosphatidylinositol-3,5-bisphosphate 5-phosphatase [Ceratobasidium sp. 428]|nr:phosphatidylinositol-3,5-bisphosphate 5-phosphatase [Ceratobasidium sp. 428]